MDSEIVKDVPFYRASGSSYLKLADRKYPVYTCCMCGALCVSKTDHALFHQRMVEAIQKISYQRIEPETLSKMTFRPIEVQELHMVDVV